MKYGFRAFCMMVFLMGAISFSSGLIRQKSEVEPSRPYVGVYFEAQTTPEGKMTITGWRTRYVKANGEFRIVMHGSDAAAAFAGDANAFSGASSPVYVKSSEGSFVKASGADDRKSMSPPPPVNLENTEKIFHSHNFLKNHAQFVRMDKVAGFEVYVMRSVNQENPNYWSEDSVSPLTGRIPLRSVIHNADGTLYTIEAVRVEFKDVPDNLNEDIKSLPHTGKLGEKMTETPKNQ